MTIYAAPGAEGAKHVYKAQYNNFIGGQWVAPVKGQYFDVITPVSGKVYSCDFSYDYVKINADYRS